MRPVISASTLICDIWKLFPSSRPQLSPKLIFNTVREGMVPRELCLILRFKNTFEPSKVLSGASSLSSLYSLSPRETPGLSRYLVSSSVRELVRELSYFLHLYVAMTTYMEKVHTDNISLLKEKSLIFFKMFGSF